MHLDTQRLHIGALRDKDAAALFAYRGDPVVARYQGWWPASLAETEEWIGGQATMPAPGHWYQRAIRLAGDDRLIGDMGVRLPVADEAAEFGISIAPLHQGWGYAREAVRALLGWLFSEMKQRRVCASVDPRNQASMALLRSLGLRQEAHFRQSLQVRGEWVDDVVFALLATEWPSAAP
ncbi:Protein N-acetyltransferase, RimJ/RimL family [Dyella sp. OK004]|uniref:GNAT family N-acetyltransferase n=1 Tax=Dyella sp. OK004 TaxID=1855292 RepID=UPI0008E87CA3|nr:GNAT family protein [Dyella sp. OK004]SFS03149.1 Protein N-acetyltransferase, RimJ/RimL family [Dyella sp. OK004]